MLLQQMAEFEEGGGIRDIFIEKVDAHKSAHGLTVLQGIFQHLIRERKPTLQQIHPQHDLNAFGGTSMLTCWVKGTNEFSPFLPGDNCFHLIEKHFPASPSLLVLELDIPKGLLSTHPEPPSTFLCSLYPFRGYIEGVINQWFPRSRISLNLLSMPFWIKRNPSVSDESSIMVFANLLIASRTS